MKRYLLFLGALLMIAPAISQAAVKCKTMTGYTFCSGLSTDSKPSLEQNDEFWETDTKDLYKRANGAWSLYVNGSAGANPGVSLYTPNGDSAMDDTADAVKTVGQVGGSSVSSSNPVPTYRAPTTTYATSVDVDSAACTTTCSQILSVSDLKGARTVRVRMILTSATSLDAMKVWIGTPATSGGNLYDAPPTLGGSTGVTATDYSTPVWPLLSCRSGTSGALDATCDAVTLDQNDYLDLEFATEGASALLIMGSAGGDNQTINLSVTY